MQRFDTFACLYNKGTKTLSITTSKNHLPPMKRFLLLTFALLGLLTISSAQVARTQHLTDVIYTTGGRILQGTIVEQIPGVSYTILTLEGNTYTIDALNIERITKEAVVGAVANNQLPHPLLNYKIDQNGNAIFPLDPLGAFVRSLIVPGLGQIYNGQGLKGALLFTGSLTGALGVLWFADAFGSDAVGWTGVTLFAGCYLYSLIDAPAVASRWNRQHGFRFNGDQYLNITPVISVIADQNTPSDTALGMSLSLTF